MSRARKVLFISNYYLPHIGGVETHVREVSSQLISKCEISVLAHKHDDGLKDFEVINGVSVYRFSYPKIKCLGLIILWFRLFKFIPLIFKQDVIHVHDVFIWFLPFRFIFTFKKVFVTLHGWEGRYPVPITSLIQKQIAYRLSNGCVCVGDYLTKYYKIKPKVVMYGARTNRENYSGKKRKDLIVFLGRLSPDTGLNELLDSVHKLKNYKIIFCGDGELRFECEKIGVVKGFVNNPNRYLSKARFCISGGYLSIFDSLSNKCVTVVMAQNKMRKAIFEPAPFEKWIVLLNNKSQLISFFNNLNKINLADSKAKKGYEWVVDQTWAKIANQYLELWEI